MLVYGKNVLKDIDVKRIRKVYISETLRSEKLFSDLKEKHITYRLLSKKQLDRMVNGNHQGIVLEIDDYLYYSYESILKDRFIVALDHLEDVHNFGAIIRTCEAAGVKSILIPKNRSVRITDTVMKTSVGALDRVHIVQVSNLCETLKKLKKENYFIYSSFMDGVDYKTLDYTGKKVLVIGSESKGVSPLLAKISDYRIGIPMNGKVNSLNASVAAGILIFAMK